MSQTEFVPLSVRIRNATNKLKNMGYVVFTDDDEKFAILAEKQKILCKTTKDFFDTVERLSKENV